MRADIYGGNAHEYLRNLALRISGIQDGDYLDEADVNQLEELATKLEHTPPSVESTDILRARLIELKAEQERKALRDYFAGQALASIMGSEDWETFSYYTVADSCYEMADQMVRARDQ